MKIKRNCGYRNKEHQIQTLSLKLRNAGEKGIIPPPSPSEAKIPVAKDTAAIVIQFIGYPFIRRIPNMIITAPKMRFKAVPESFIRSFEPTKTPKSPKGINFHDCARSIEPLEK